MGQATCRVAHGSRTVRGFSFFRVLKAEPSLLPDAAQLGGDLRTVPQSRRALFTLGWNHGCGGWAGQVPPKVRRLQPMCLPVCRARAETESVPTLCAR